MTATGVEIARQSNLDKVLVPHHKDDDMSEVVPMRV